jgi:adenine-specific DNA-methyltransferase
MADYGWRPSTGPLVWNRHKRQITGRPTDGSVPILWAADIDGGRVLRSPAREAQRWIDLRPREEFMILRESAVLVQRTTAPEQARRLVAAHLDCDTIAGWGGGVVVENHVNVLRCADPSSPLTPELLAALLRTSTIDRLYRCITGTVAVSAYELSSLPLPAPEVIRAWANLPETELERVVGLEYGDAAS